MDNKSFSILSSAELRWFFNDQLPIPWKKWIEGFVETKIKGEKRVDYYLKLDRKDLGIKVRPYAKKRHIEFKFLLHQRRKDKPVKGIQERWVKWSIGIPKTLKLTMNDNTLWHKVSKERFLVKVGLRKDQLKVVTSSQQIKIGCNVELTQLLFNHKRYWSLAFEAFGPENTLQDTLKRIVNFMSLNFPAKVSSKNSYGYPQWLMN